MNVVKPHDPRAPQTHPDELSEKVGEILSAPVGSLSEEVEQLGRAHELLHEALHGE